MVTTIILNILTILALSIMILFLYLVHESFRDLTKTLVSLTSTLRDIHRNTGGVINILGDITREIHGNTKDLTSVLSDIFREVGKIK